MLQGTSIFVSTLSITAIALDRRRLIVYPHKVFFEYILNSLYRYIIWGKEMLTGFFAYW